MKKPAFLVISLLITALLTAQQIRVKPGTKITITPGNTLDVAAGNFLLESDDTGDASLLNRGSITFSGGGQAVVERYIGAWTTTTTAGISSPRPLLARTSNLSLFLIRPQLPRIFMPGTK